MQKSIRYQVTQNFWHSEFLSWNSDGSGGRIIVGVPPHLWAGFERLCESLQALRDDIGRPLNINSGYRTDDHNRHVYAQLGIHGDDVPKSWHLKAQAADIDLDGLGMDAAELQGRINALVSRGQMEQGGIGLYNTFLHYDNRGYKRRWDKR